MKKLSLFVIFALLSSCLSPALKRDPPNIYYQIDKVDHLLLTNSQMFIQRPLIHDDKTNSNEITFRLMYRKTDGPVTQVDTQKSEFKFNGSIKSPDCQNIQLGDSGKIECKIILSPEEVLKLGKSDLIGELAIPLAGGAKWITSSIFIRNEDLK
jgi:hypothetical protein